MTRTTSLRRPGGGLFASLRFHNYRIWFLSALVANTGTWMQRVAQDWLVLRVLTDDSASATGLTTALQFLPMLLLSAHAGLVADRVDQRKFLILTQSAMGLVSAVLAVDVLAGRAQLWHVYLAALATGVVSAYDAPARQIFVARMVPSRDLANAVGLNSTGFNLARLIGPAVAGTLISAVGTGWVFVVNGLSFVFTIGALLAIRTGELYVRQVDPEDLRGRGRVREGLRYVASRGDLTVIFLVLGTVACLTLNFQLTSAAMARTVFDKNGGEYGVLGSVLAVGSVTGALMAARRRTTPRTRTVVVAAGLCGVTSGVSAVMPTYATFAVSLMFVGFTQLLLFTSANTVVQVSTEPTVRGRVMSLYQTVIMGTSPIGSIVVGWIAEVASPRWGIGMGSIVAFAMVAWAYLWGRRHWGGEEDSNRAHPWY